MKTLLDFNSAASETSGYGYQQEQVASDQVPKGELPCATIAPNNMKSLQDDVESWKQAGRDFIEISCLVGRKLGQMQSSMLPSQFSECARVVGMSPDDAFTLNQFARNVVLLGYSPSCHMTVEKILGLIGLLGAYDLVSAPHDDADTSGFSSEQDDYAEIMCNFKDCWEHLAYDFILKSCRLGTCLECVEKSLGSSYTQELGLSSPEVHTLLQLMQAAHSDDDLWSYPVSVYRARNLFRLLKSGVMDDRCK